MSKLVAKEKEVTLLDLLDRILDKGVILFGDVTLSVADVDLIYLGLKVLLTSIEKAETMRRMAAPQYSQNSTLKVQREMSSVKRETMP